MTIEQLQEDAGRYGLEILVRPGQGRRTYQIGIRKFAEDKDWPSYGTLAEVKAFLDGVFWIGYANAIRRCT